MAEQRPDVPPAACWPAGPRPGSGDAMAGAVRAALTTAVALARAGDCRGARHLCATVVLDAQPIIVARKDLLAVALHALLVAQGFRLLSSVVMAMSGRSVRVTLLAECSGPIAPPRVHHEPGCASIVLDPRWLARLAPDDGFLRHWCDALTAPQPCLPILTEPEPVSRQLEPV